jgi:hypothetical protein
LSFAQAGLSPESPVIDAGRRATGGALTVASLAALIIFTVSRAPSFSDPLTGPASPKLSIPAAKYGDTRDGPRGQLGQIAKTRAHGFRESLEMQPHGLVGFAIGAAVAREIDDHTTVNADKMGGRQRVLPGFHRASHQEPRAVTEEHCGMIFAGFERGDGGQGDKPRRAFAGLEMNQIVGCETRGCQRRTGLIK